MDNISLNGQHELRKSRSGRILIPRLKNWTGERAVVTKKGTLEILEGNLDYTSTFQSERSLLNASALHNHSQIFFRKPVVPQTRLTRSFSDCVSSKQAKIKEKQNVGSQARPSPKKNVGSPVKPSPKKNLGSPVKPSPKKNLGSPVKPSPKRNLGSQIKPSPTMNLRQRKWSPEKSVLSNTVSSSNKISPLRMGKRKTAVPATKGRTPSPRKNLRKQQCESQEEEDIDIFGPEFQPVVRLVRLLPEEILSLTERKSQKRGRNSPVKSIALPIHEVASKGPKQRKPKLVAQINLIDFGDSRSRRFSNRLRPRTVKETQQMLSVFNSKDREELDDEAMITAAFFGHSPNLPAMKLLDEAVEILRDDFASDDNLSIRALSERESSPMSSAVSPIGSFHETDAEISGREDVLMKPSPATGSSSDFQRARLLHRTLKDKARLLKKAQCHKAEDITLDSTLRPVNATPKSSQILKPRTMRALEKDLKERTMLHGKLDYSTYYRGNLLHITVNSDSESNSSVADSLEELEIFPI